LEDQEAQIGSELRDFLMALRDSTMPLIAHVAIKSGRRSLCRHAVWLRVTDLSEEMVIFTSDEIPASFISCDHYQLDPVRENIAVEFQSQYLNQVRDREQWVAYFKGRVRKVYNEGEAREGQAKFFGGSMSLRIKHDYEKRPSGRFSFHDYSSGVSAAV
jgi:hypothetical protein